jgi:hypothetical protein
MQKGTYRNKICDKHAPGKIFLQRPRNSNRITNPISSNVSKLPSVDILVMANVDIYAIVSTIENYENRTVTPISIQSTVANNNSIKQNVIYLSPIFPNSRITLFPYSNIQGNVTIILWHK